MKISKIFFLLILIAAFSGCASHNKQSHSENNAEKKLTDFSSQITPVQKEALNGWLTAYFDLKNALVETNSSKAKERAAAFINQLKATEATAFQGEAVSFVELHKNELLKHLEQTASATDIEVQRTHFVGITQSVYEIAKSFKPNTQKVYYQFCPMAFDDKGGFWLNEQEKVYNPYFGDKMLHCGKVVTSF